MTSQIERYFGSRYLDVNLRMKSYDFLQNFVNQQHNWASGRAPDSDVLAAQLRQQLRAFSREDFAFLLCHTGYIPEEYAHDSSEETIYTKLVEVIVGEWATRIGFDRTTLPKQKSSYEDITIQDQTYIVVADAKSYRLGRSQKAPNVKDALKEGDFPKWLKNYSNSGLTALGGLVTFPAQHDWATGSDFYLYLTNHRLPIVCLFYEHLSFMILTNMSKATLIDTYLAYEQLFPYALTKAQKNRAIYWTNLEQQLFNGVFNEWVEFQKFAQELVGEKIHHTIESMKFHLNHLKAAILSEIPPNASNEELRQMLAEARTERVSFMLTRQLECINSFRTYRSSYFSPPENLP